MDKIYRAVCPHCGKEFISLYEEQLNFNFRVHKDKCKQTKGGKK